MFLFYILVIPCNADRLNVIGQHFIYESLFVATWADQKTMNEKITD